MTTEQREAIKICEHYKNILYACNYEKGPERTGQAIDTVLSLIKEQSAELLQKNAEIAEKDKIIDLMAYTLQDNLYLTPLDGLNKEELKQYFEKLAKKGE